MRTFGVLSLSLLISALLASSAQAGFGCSASAARLTVLGQTIEPVTANAGGAECVGDAQALTTDALGLPLGLSAGALVSATEFFPVQKTIVASGGVADLRVKALPALPIALPKVEIPAAVKTALNGVLSQIDLSGVKAVALDALPDPQALQPLVDPLTNLPLVGSLLTSVTQQNQVIQATNAQIAAVKGLIEALPSTVTVDDNILSALLTNLQLPDVDLLRIQGAMAYAGASCQSGTPGVSGSSRIAAVSVLGQELPLDQVVDRVIKLIEAAPLNVTDLTVSASDLGLTADQLALITGPAKTTLDSVLQTVTTTLKNALAGANITLPEVLAQIKVTPGAQVKTADAVTQQALTVLVTVAGQTLVEGVIGEAKASVSGVDCAAPVVDPDSPAGQVLTCEGRSLVLTDVFQRGNRVKLMGIADPAYVGQTVNIVLDATNKVVARVKVAEDGSFDTTAPLPPANIRETDLARYQAQLGDERSSNLKLRRRFVLESLTYENGKVTFVGRLAGPLGTPIQPIELRRRVSCTETRMVTRFKPRRNGRFRISVRAPKNVGTAVYTMKTLVRSSVGGSGLFETYMLPRAIELSK